MLCKTMSIKIHSINYISTSVPTCNLIASYNYNTTYKYAYIRITNIGNDTAVNVYVRLNPDTDHKLCIVGVSGQGNCLSNVRYTCFTANVPSLSPNCYFDLSVQIRSGITIYGTITTDTEDLGTGLISGSINCENLYCQPINL